MAIGASAHKLILDTTSFTSGAVLSRKELQFLKGALQETATATEKFGAGQQVIADLLGKGALSTEQAERAMNKLRDETDGQSSAMDKLRGAFVPTIDVVYAATAAIKLVAGAWNLAKSAGDALVDTVKDQLKSMDDLITHSQTLGITAGQFQAIAHAAELSDVEMNAVGSSIEKMLVATSKGADGMKEFENAFKMLGLDSEKLRTSSPDVQLTNILNALQGIGNQADKVRIATQIFGSPDLLRMSASAIGEAAERLRMFGGEIDSLRLDQFNQFDESSVKLKQNFDSLAKGMTAELVPALTEAAGLLNDMLTDKGTDGSLRGNLTYAIDMATGFLAASREARHEQEAWVRVVLGIPQFVPFPSVSTNFGDLGSAIRESGRLDSAMRKIEADRAKWGLEPPTGEGLPGGRVDTMYEEMEALDKLNAKYRERSIEMGLSGPFLEIHRAIKEGLRGEELKAFKIAVDKREMEKLRLVDLETELKIKQEINAVDTSVARVGSAEAARIAAAAFARGDAMSGPMSDAGEKRSLEEIARNTRERLRLEVVEVTL